MKNCPVVLLDFQQQKIPVLLSWSFFFLISVKFCTTVLSCSCFHNTSRVLKNQNTYTAIQLVKYYKQNATPSVLLVTYKKTCPANLRTISENIKICPIVLLYFSKIQNTCPTVSVIFEFVKAKESVLLSCPVYVFLRVQKTNPVDLRTETEERKKVPCCLLDVFQNLINASLLYCKQIVKTKKTCPALLQDIIFQKFRKIRVPLLLSCW